MCCMEERALISLMEAKETTSFSEAKRVTGCGEVEAMTKFILVPEKRTLSTVEKAAMSSRLTMAGTSFGLVTVNQSIMKNKR